MSEHAYTVTKRVGVHQLDGVVQGFSFQYHELRAKDFLGVDVHLGGHTREQGMTNAPDISNRRDGALYVHA